MKDHHNQSPRSTSRSKSPKPPSNESHRRQPHHSGSRSKRHHHHHPHDAVIFPPDPKEKGVDVINRIYRSFGLTDKFPQDCQQQLQEILTVDPCGPEFMEPTKQDDDDDDDDGWTTTHPKDRHHNKSASATASSVKLKDLTHLPYITIDNDDSMDLDQAMYICWAKCPPLLDEKDITEHSTTSTQAARNFHESFVCPEGGQEENPINKDHDAILVSYALADGAYFVPALSPLFQHALRRGGTSFYLPTKSIPMLPRELSEDRMSLRPNRKRRALVLDMYLRATDASVIRTFYRYAVVQSRWKGSYRQVSEYYDAMDNRKQQQQQPTHWIVDETFRETIDLLRVVGQKRIRLAKQRNVVQYDRGSGAGAVTIDPRTGLLTFQATTRERYSSEKYNEQISLLCNMEGAKMLAFLDDLEEKIPGAKDILHPIYRTQSGPRGDQTETLEHVIVNTLQVHGLDAAEWKWRRDDGETLASYLERLRDHVDAIDGDENPNWKQKWKRVVMVIDRQAQITNQAASFSASPEDGHHALKANYYARFSSPMRELVGCYTHKELLEAHLGRFSNEHLSVKKDIELRNNVIRAAVRAKEIQKRLGGMVFLHMLNTLFYQDLKTRLHERKIYTGVIMGMDFSDRQKSRRVYVQLDEPHIQIKVYAEDLDYHYNCRYGPEDGDTFNKRGCTVSIVPMPGSFTTDVDDAKLPPKFRAGDPVSIRVGDYAQFYGQKSRSRWVFIMIPQQIEEDEQHLRHSLVRNSVIDIDVLGRMEELSQISSSSDFTDESERAELDSIMDTSTP